MDKENSGLDLSFPRVYDCYSNSSKNTNLNANEAIRTGYDIHTKKSDDLYKNLLERATQSSHYIEKINLAIPKGSTSNLPLENEPTKFSLAYGGINSNGTIPSSRLPLSPINQSFNTINTETYKAFKHPELLKSSSSKTILYEVTKCSTNQTNENITEENITINDFQDGRNVKISQPVPLNAPLKSSLAKRKKYSIVSDDEIQGMNQAVTIYPKREYMIHQMESSPKATIHKTVKMALSPSKFGTARGPKGLKNTKHHKQTKSNTSLALDEKEEAEFNLEDKYMNLKRKAKDMRATILELVAKYTETENLLEQRNHQLQEFQQNYKRAHADILNQLHKLQEFSQKEEIWARAEQELQYKIMELTISETENKRRFDEIAFVIEANEKKYLSQLDTLETEKQAVNNDLRVQDRIVQEQNYTIENLQKELEALRKELRTADSKLQATEAINSLREQEKYTMRGNLEELEEINAKQSAKIKELNQEKIQLEGKLNKYKSRFEEERSKLQQDNEKEIYDKKEKLRGLKDSFKEAETQIQRLHEDKRSLEEEVESYKRLNSKLEHENQSLESEIITIKQNKKELEAAYDSLKEKNEEVFSNLQSECENSTQLKIELKKAAKSLKKIEERNRINEKNSAMVEEIVGKLKEEIKLLLQENAQAKGYIGQLESTLNLINAQQVEVSREIGNLKQERDYYFKNLEIANNINKNHEDNLRIIDQKVREFLLHRETEAHSVKDTQNQNQIHVCTKLKTLNDIQELIKDHRKSQKERNSDPIYSKKH